MNILGLRFLSFISTAIIQWSSRKCSSS